MEIIPVHTAATRPKGAPFTIDRGSFRYGETIDAAAIGIEEDKILNWPMLYILANDKTAYIGQTTSIINRMGQHSASEEKKDFTNVSIIYNEEFNASVITDYEHRLIGLMHADGKYRLTNKNEGMTDTNYFSKSEYAAMFEDLWAKLRQFELVEHSIYQIEESEVFKYSPYKGLTPDQKVALDTILSAIEHGLDRAEPIMVEGVPGTGKTILAIYLLKALKDNPDYRDLNIRILEPVTALKETLRKSLKNVSGLSEKDIIGPADLTKPQYGYSKGNGKCFDIVLVDEAHKLKQRVNLGTQFGNYDKMNNELGLLKESTHLDWVLNQVKLPIFFYDPLQSVGPSCVKHDAVCRSLGLAAQKPIKLDSQMRVKGGSEYLEYIRSILDGNNPAPQTFEGYELVFHNDFRDFVDSFEATYREHSLSRMVAGYAWKWRTKDMHDPDLYDIVIDGIGLRWNITYDNWVGRGFSSPSTAHEVGCIHSIQGYDLSFAYVIIGEDLRLADPLTGTLQADANKYFDRNGKVTATPEELTQYIKNIYYVLLTRGIYGTHIYVRNPELRAYLSKYF